MRKKIYIRILVIILVSITLLLTRQVYLYNKYDANLVIRFFNQAPDESELKIEMFFDGIEHFADTINYSSSMGWIRYGFKESLGSHDIRIINKNNNRPLNIKSRFLGFEYSTIEDNDIKINFSLLFVKVINIYYEGNNRFEIDIRYSLPDVLL